MPSARLPLRQIMDSNADPSPNPDAAAAQRSETAKRPEQPRLDPSRAAEGTSAGATDPSRSGSGSAVTAPDPVRRAFLLGGVALLLVVAGAVFGFYRSSRSGKHS